MPARRGNPRRKGRGPQGKIWAPINPGTALPKEKAKTNSKPSCTNTARRAELCDPLLSRGSIPGVQRPEK